MRSSKNILLKTGLLLSLVGAVIYFHPLYSEPMWLEWLAGPALIYLGLPLAIVGLLIHFFGGNPKNTASLPQVKTRG